jgi:hypothetical protein
MGDATGKVIVLVMDSGIVMGNTTGKVLVTATGITTLEVFIIDDDIRVRGMTH